jgi:hypothetical protein
MRLRVDPEAATDLATHADHDDVTHRCMQGAFLQASERGLHLLNH